VCATMDAPNVTVKGTLLSARAMAMAPARRMLWHAEMLARRLSVCRSRDGSTERLREMTTESYRVIASGSCFEATTRILTTGFDERGGGVRALAEKARRNLYLELNSIDAGSMMYMERAFVSNETLARVIPIIFAAFDECRTEGRLWSSPVPEDAFEAVRAHYSTLDFLLTDPSSIARRTALEPLRFSSTPPTTRFVTPNPARRVKRRSRVDSS